MADQWWQAAGRKPKRPKPSFDTSVAHIARVYDYWLGGKDNFAADREAGKQTMLAYPDIALAVRANRAFLARAVRYLTAEAGIRQFLDIGTGLPTANNTHEVAQSIAPQCRVVCVDNDPMVLAHARARLASTPDGAVVFLDGDLRAPDKIVAQAAEELDFAEPVGVILVGVLQLLLDEDSPHEIVTRLMAATAPGSYLAVAHPASDMQAEKMAEFVRRYNNLAAEQAKFRTRDEVARFFDGLALVEPGLVPQPAWRPTSQVEAASPTAVWAGIARKL
jgi:O-methyltransferase involved in polyketide biosynthesis